MFDNVQKIPRYYDSRNVDSFDEMPTRANEAEKVKRARREARVKSWWYQEKVRQGPNRKEMATDEDFYDNLQWEQEDKLALEEVGQAALTLNEVHPAIEWIVGTEKRTRIDWAVLPRRKDHEKEAITKTGVIKYISDVNKLPFQRSRAFKQAVISGLSWMEYGYDEDPGDFDIFGSWESWRNIWHDSLATDWITMKDWRYIHRSRVMDLDVAQAMFPDHRDSLRRSADSTLQSMYHRDEYTETQLYYTGSAGAFSSSVNDALADSHGRRARVRLIETWYREPVPVKRMKDDPDYLGEIYDPEDPMHGELVEAGQVSLYDDVYMQMRVMIHIDEGPVLQDIKSPYRHNRFPFVPLFCYIRARDNMPYGPVRMQRDPQEDLNKRRSKMLYLLSVKRTVMDEGAVRDMDKFEEEISRPDSIIEKRKGYELEILENQQLAEGHLQIERLDAQYIREIGGVTGENMGRETNATSGKAIRARQDQGATVTQSIFDNLRLHTQMSGEILLSLTEQYLTDEDEFRITGNRNTHEFLSINQAKEDGSLENDITSHQADFVVSEQDWSASHREAMFVTMAEMLSQMDSQIAIQMLDLLVDLADNVPNKDEMVARIRKINGQVDPETQTEEDRMKQEQAEAQAAAEERAVKMQEIYLNFQEQAAKIDSTRMDAAKDYIAALKDAVDTAGAQLQAPILAEIADYMMQEALEPKVPMTPDPQIQPPPSNPTMEQMPQQLPQQPA